MEGPDHIPTPVYPRDFGLDETRVRYFQRGVEANEGLVIVAATVGLVSGVAAGAAASTNPFVALLTGFIGTSACSALAEWTNRLLVRRARQRLESEPDFQRFCAYSSASAEYKRQSERYLRSQQAFWNELDGWTFELELSRLFAEWGWCAEPTPGSGDGGVDIELWAGNHCVLVQCKAQVKNVGPGPVRELYGTLMHHGAQEAWLVTTAAAFSPAAKAFAKGKPLRLITMAELLAEPSVLQAQGATPQRPRSSGAGSASDLLKGQLPDSGDWLSRAKKEGAERRARRFLGQ